MATEKKLTDTEVSLKIINIEADPTDKLKQRKIVSIQFDDNTGKGPWVQGFSLAPAVVLNIDDFLENLAAKDIHRPENPWIHLEAAQKEGKTFVLDLSHRIAPKPKS